MAPALVDIETAHAVGGLGLGRKVTQQDARRAIAALPRLGISRVQRTDLLPRTWELRSNCSAYDAAHIALAELMGVPLVTGDARLARGAGARCVVEVVG